MYTDCVHVNKSLREQETIRIQLRQLHYIHFNKIRKQAFLMYNIKVKWNSQILNTNTTTYPGDTVTIFTPFLFC